MLSTDIPCELGVETAREIVLHTLSTHDFTLVANGSWQGIATRGNKVANVVGGALAQYFEIGWSVFSGEIQGSVVRLEQGNAGYAGGLIGMSRTKSKFREVAAAVEQAIRFQEVAVLASGPLAPSPSRPIAPVATSTTDTAGGWHADPYHVHRLRWWDGQKWTGHVIDAGGAQAWSPIT